MSLNGTNLMLLDEEETFQYRCSLLTELIDRISRIGVKDEERRSDTEIVSILKLQSLKKGNMMSRSPSAKLELISEDKQQLNTWINNYKVEFKRTREKDSVKIAIFREAATRLKMLLDHSDFDEGDYRIMRRKAITEINDMLSEISGL